jgi:hypothetical protein
VQPLDPARRVELAAGTDDQPGILVDTIGSPQRSAQLGLPIFGLGGGAGYVWSVSWNGRGRGALRMLAIDASRLPGAAAEAKPSADPAAIVPAPTSPAVVTAAPTSPPLDAPKPADTTQLAPSIAARSKSVEPAPVAAPQAKTPAAAATPPTDVRVVGPPIALRPTASAAKPTPTPSSSADGNGLVIFLIALIVALLGVVGYLLKKSRAAPPAAVAGVPGGVIAKPTQATPPEVHVAPESEKMDLKAMVPAESPANVAALATAMQAPRVDEAMAYAATFAVGQTAKNLL